MTGRKRITVRLPDDEHLELRRYAHYVGITVQETAHRAISAFLASQTETDRIDAMLAQARTVIRQTVQRYNESTRAK